MFTEFCLFWCLHFRLVSGIIILIVENSNYRVWRGNFCSLCTDGVLSLALVTFFGAQLFSN